MPAYFFNLHTAKEIVRDLVGTDLADEASARKHAQEVARELMRNREPRTRSWRLVVRDSKGRQVFRLLLATVDGSLEELSPELRRSLENMCAQSASLSDTIHTVRRSLLEIKGTMARADRLPYLAAT